MKNKSDRFNENASGKESAKRLINPYPEFPALPEGKAGSVFISYIVVYYSLN